MGRLRKRVASSAWATFSRSDITSDIFWNSRFRGRGRWFSGRAIRYKTPLAPKCCAQRRPTLTILGIGLLAVRNRVFERNPFGVVFAKPCLGGGGPTQ